MSRSVQPSLVPLPYSAERANRSLPLVRRIVDDLVACYAGWQGAVSRFEYATTRSRADEPDADAQRWQLEVQQLAAQVEGFVRELQELGLECRSIDTGLVDFPGELDGRPVYFCWMRGERAVEHWHATDAGFGARQPLPESEFARK